MRLKNVQLYLKHSITTRFCSKHMIKSSEKWNRSPPRQVVCTQSLEKPFWQSATLQRRGHRSSESRREQISGPALHHPLILLTSVFTVVSLTAHAERGWSAGRGGAGGGREENDCISEGIRRADMDVRGVTWSDTSWLSY